MQFLLVFLILLLLNGSCTDVCAMKNELYSLLQIYTFRTGNNLVYLIKIKISLVRLDFSYSSITLFTNKLKHWMIECRLGEMYPSATLTQPFVSYTATVSDCLLGFFSFFTCIIFAALLKNLLFTF